MLWGLRGFIVQDTELTKVTTLGSVLIWFMEVVLQHINVLIITGKCLFCWAWIFGLLNQDFNFNFLGFDIFGKIRKIWNIIIERKTLSYFKQWWIYRFCHNPFDSILVPLMLAIYTSIENRRCLICASCLSLLIVGFATIAFGAEGVGNGQLLHALILFDDLKLFIVNISDYIFLLFG